MILRINKQSDKESVISYIDKLPDKQFIVTIEKKKVTRTISQNSLYWMWINCISKETGNEPNDLHEYFGELKFPKVEVKMFDGSTRTKPMSTTKMDTVQFKEVLDWIQMFASTELGLILPNPEDKYFEEMANYYNDRF